MAAGYGFSHVHEPQPRKRVFYRVTPQIDQQWLHDSVTQAMRQESDAFMDKAVAKIKRSVGRPKRTTPTTKEQNNG